MPMTDISVTIFPIFVVTSWRFILEKKPHRRYCKLAVLPHKKWGRDLPIKHISITISPVCIVVSWILGSEIKKNSNKAVLSTNAGCLQIQPNKFPGYFQDTFNKHMNIQLCTTIQTRKRGKA